NRWSDRGGEACLRITGGKRIILAEERRRHILEADRRANGPQWRLLLPTIPSSASGQTGITGDQHGHPPGRTRHTQHRYLPAAGTQGTTEKISSKIHRRRSSHRTGRTTRLKFRKNQEITWESFENPMTGPSTN